MRLTESCYVVARRTFEAATKPAGSPERAALNGDPLTSEYMTSYRYMLREKDGSKTPYSFRSKADAVRAAERLGR